VLLAVVGGDGAELDQGLLVTLGQAMETLEVEARRGLA
jgi:hypothetical protein